MSHNIKIKSIKKTKTKTQKERNNDKEALLSQRHFGDIAKTTT